MLVLVGCSGGDGGSSDGGGSASPTTNATADVASTVPSTKAPASGIVPRTTSRQCVQSLAALTAGIEVLMVQTGTPPQDLEKVIESSTTGLSDGAVLDASKTVLTVTEFAITYELRYDPAKGEVSAVTIAPPEQAGPGCP